MSTGWAPPQGNQSSLFREVTDADAKSLSPSGETGDLTSTLLTLGSPFNGSHELRALHPRRTNWESCELASSFWPENRCVVRRASLEGHGSSSLEDPIGMVVRIIWHPKPLSELQGSQHKNLEKSALQVPFSTDVHSLTAWYPSYTCCCQSVACVTVPLLCVEGPSEETGWDELLLRPPSQGVFPGARLLPSGNVRSPFKSWCLQTCVALCQKVLHLVTQVFPLTYLTS